MSEQKYSFEGFNKETMARAIGKNLFISTKKTLEICTSIRGKKVKAVRTYLNRVLKMEDSIHYRRFNQELAHNQRGPGGYPINAIKEVLSLIKDAESNAKAKGLHTASLKIVHIVANRGGKSWHYGRQKRRLQKRTHLEVVLEEVKSDKKVSDKKNKSEIKTKDVKVENKKEDIKSDNNTQEKKTKTSEVKKDDVKDNLKQETVEVDNTKNSKVEDEK